VRLTEGTRRPAVRPGHEKRGAGLEEAELRAAIEEHLPLVRALVCRIAAHFPRHVDREELAGAGALGLVQAARRYDRGRGVPFRQFVAQRIRGAILDAARAADWAPRSVRALARTLESVEDGLAGDLRRTPSPHELAQGMGTTGEELRRLQDRIHTSAVLALEFGLADDEDEGGTLRASVVDTGHPDPSEQLELRELHAYVREAVSLLPDRHRFVIASLLEGRRLADPARSLGVSASRVSQIRDQALAMLKASITAQFEDDPFETDRLAA
jgi:RNA polymerase sigma factor FliA